MSQTIDDQPASSAASGPASEPGSHAAKARPLPWSQITKWTLGIALLAAVGSASGWGWWNYVYQNQPEQRFRRGVAAMMAHDLETVRFEALRLDGVPGYQPHFHLFWGVLRLADGKPYDALDSFGNCLEHKDTRVHALVLSGECLYRVHRYNEADQVLIRALEYDPDNIDAHRWLAAVYYDLGAADLAVQYLAYVNDADPTDPRPARLIGLIHRDFDRFAQAVNPYLESLRRDPNQPAAREIHFELAGCLMNARRYDEALSHLDQCQAIIASDPVPVTDSGDPAAEDQAVYDISLADVEAIKAECFRGKGETERAKELLEQALKLNPDHRSALMALADICLEDGETERAADLLTHNVAKSPSDFLARYKLSQILSRLNRPEEAAHQQAESARLRKLNEDYKGLHMQALREPYNADIRFQLGRLSDERLMPEAAIIWYRAALSIDPGMEKAQLNLQKSAARLAELKSSSSPGAGSDTATP